MLLCEQVIGRSLRRYSYQLNEQGVFNAEYADILGIPFDFATEPVDPPPPPPPETVLVTAISPDRDECEIVFPRVVGYRLEIPEERLSATFDANSVLVLDDESVGPAVTHNQAIIGEGVDLDLKHLRENRRSTVAYRLAKTLLERHWRDSNGDLKLYLFGQLKHIAREWMDNCLICTEGHYVAQVLYESPAQQACERIMRGITQRYVGERPVRAILDSYNPTGSTKRVHFHSSRRPVTKHLVSGKSLWRTAPDRCHVNLAACDSSWEADFCRLAESTRRVRAYVKNQGLGFEVPYRYGKEARIYLPDFILLIDDGKGDDNLLHLVVEIKGYRSDSVKDKTSTMENYWIPGVNALGTFGRWAFIELGDARGLDDGFEARYSIRRQFTRAMWGFLREISTAASRRLARIGGTQPDAEYIPRRKSEIFQ